MKSLFPFSRRVACSRRVCDPRLNIHYAVAAAPLVRAGDASEATAACCIDSIAWRVMRSANSLRLPSAGVLARLEARLLGDHQADEHPEQSLARGAVAGLAVGRRP